MDREQWRYYVIDTNGDINVSSLIYVFININLSPLALIALLYAEGEGF